MVTVFIESVAKEINPGLQSGIDLYNLAKCKENELFFSRDGDLDTQVSKEDYIIIYGGENFVVDSKNGIPRDNLLRNPISIKFNSDELSLAKGLINVEELVSKDNLYPNGRLFAEFEEEVDEEVPLESNLILQNQYKLFVVPRGESSEIDIGECSKNNRKIPTWTTYSIKLNGKNFVVNERILTGTKILNLLKLSPADWRLYKKFSGTTDRRQIKPDDEVDLTIKGVEKFEAVPMDAAAG